LESMFLLFWICVSVILYVYAGYPLLLALGLLGEKRPIRKGQILPSLSIIVPAHNEERCIRSKLLNLLSQDYPRDKVQILVGNDGSTDRTAEIVAEFMHQGVQSVSSSEAMGKSAIQNSLVSRASGEILVFTDADCFLPTDGLRTMVQSFVDLQVGLVTNCASFLNDGETPTVEGESLYWRYERWLRNEESDRKLLAMASGSLFAMRRSLWGPLEPEVGDDFALPLRVAKAGCRNVLETRVSAETVLSQNQPRSMFRTKMRIVSKDLRGLLRVSECLNPLQVGKVAVGLWSHKLLRWCIPYFLIGLLFSNVLLALSGQLFYQVTLGAQALFYAIAVLGFLLAKRGSSFPFSVVSSFCLVNLAALFGTLHCCTLHSAGRWKPVR
jgi:cellulose synthase/poly-beta-1,6-N-acetylglucosamine synthase-like glycosyltransferase